MFKCPHCGKDIKEVNVVDLNFKQILVSAGLGIGFGLITFPYLGAIGTFGAFIVSSMLTFILLRRR